MLEKITSFTTQLLSISMLCVCTLLSSTAFAADSDAQDLSKRLKTLRTFTGLFTQTLVDAKGQTLQESTGKFWLQRPGFFRWETLEPFPQLLVSNLEYIWLYDPDLEQVTIRPYTQAVSQTPALLLSGDVEKIEEQYTVKKLDNNRFELLPIAEQQLFDQLTVSFNNKQLSKMILRDSLGQSTAFVFEKGVYNTKVDASQFVFEPPEGTDIVANN